MKVVVGYVLFVSLLAGCTHASISSMPMEIEGVGTVYRYQGRANFAHQIAEADRLITEDCKQRNGGRPVVVDLKKQNLGFMSMNMTPQRSTINATVRSTGYNTSNVSGVVNTTQSDTSTLANVNQEILYKCVIDK